MTTPSPDPRAVTITRILLETHAPEAAILFGSRARGDYDELRSDIDIMLVLDTFPTDPESAKIHHTANSAAQRLYDSPPPVQLIWQTRDEFARKRRAVNHIVPNALKDGIVMPRNPEEYRDRYPDDENLDYQEEWIITDERVRHATNHITMFNDAVALERDDDMIGLHAHDSMEHALKALISATGNRYERTHHINILLHDAIQADPDFDPDPAIDGSIYNQYAGSKEYYRKHSPISDIPNYHQIVNDEVAHILLRVQEIRRTVQP